MTVEGKLKKTMAGEETYNKTKKELNQFSSLTNC